MKVALDLGAYQVKSLRAELNQLTGRRLRSVFAVVPPVDTYRQLLDQMKISHAKLSDVSGETQLVLLSDDAVRFGELLQVPLLSLFPRGCVSADDPRRRELLQLLIELLLPSSESPEEPCAVILPTGATASAVNLFPPEDLFVTRLVKDRGYTPIVMNSAYASGLSELSREHRTGAVMNLGATRCELSVISRGIELAHVIIPRGGDWLDEQLATRRQMYAWDGQGEQYLDVSLAQRWKEQLATSLVASNDKTVETFETLTKQFVNDICHHTRAALTQQRIRNQLVRPLRLVLTGALAQLPGLAELFEREIVRAKWPLVVEKLIVATDPVYSAARGGLIQLALDDQSEEQSQAA